MTQSMSRFTDAPGAKHTILLGGGRDLRLLHNGSRPLCPCPLSRNGRPALA